jgi:hypothetical protein
MKVHDNYDTLVLLLLQIKLLNKIENFKCVTVMIVFSNTLEFTLSKESINVLQTCQFFHLLDTINCLYKRTDERAVKGASSHESERLK